MMEAVDGSHFPALTDIIRAGASFGARVRSVDKSEYGRSIGELSFGISVPAKAVPAGDFDDRMMVMAGFPREDMFRFLNSLKKTGVSIRLKAVLTPANSVWAPGMLRDELLREDEAVRKEH